MMFCLRCRTAVRYSFALCWWECRCHPPNRSVWATDEQAARGLN